MEKNVNGQTGAVVEQMTNKRARPSIEQMSAALEARRNTTVRPRVYEDARAKWTSPITVDLLNPEDVDEQTPVISPDGEQLPPGQAFQTLPVSRLLGNAHKALCETENVISQVSTGTRDSYANAVSMARAIGDGAAGAPLHWTFP